MDKYQAKHNARFGLLNALYENSERFPNLATVLESLGPDLGLAHTERVAAARHLAALGLLKFNSDVVVELTGLGRIEIGRRLQALERKQQEHEEACRLLQEERATSLRRLAGEPHEKLAKVETAFETRTKQEEFYFDEMVARIMNLDEPLDGRQGVVPAAQQTFINIVASPGASASAYSPGAHHTYINIANADEKAGELSELISRVRDLLLKDTGGLSSEQAKAVAAKLAEVETEVVKPQPDWSKVISVVSSVASTFNVLTTNHDLLTWAQAASTWAGLLLHQIH